MDQDQYRKTQKPKRLNSSRRRYLKEKARKKREKWLPEGVDYKPSNRRSKNVDQGANEITDNDNNGLYDNYTELCEQWHESDRRDKKQAAADKFKEEKERELELHRKYEVAQARLAEFSYPYDDYS
jgi:hypothetical protein